MGSINVVNYAYIVYLLLKKEKKVDSSIIEKYVRKSYVFNVLMESFAGNPEGTFEFDIKRIKEQGFINYFENQECSQLSDTFWDIALPGKLNTSVSSSPFYRLYLMAQCSLNDKGFLSKSISVQDMLILKGDEHHANYAFTQQEVNIKIFDNAPELYIRELKKQCKTKQLVYGGIDVMRS